MIVREGLAKLLVPDAPTIYEAEVFYNPAMAMNRDLSVLCAREFVRRIRKKVTILDLMAGTGVRGIRYALEVEGEKEIIINDINEKAFRLIKENLRMNGISAKTLRKEANLLLRELRGIDIIDIDPFGSPAPFIDSAFHAITKRQGMLSITSTDTSCLHGTYPRVCLRRYWALNERCDCSKEIGVRILLGFLARFASKYGVGIKPIVGVSQRHWIKVVVLVERGRKRADETIKNLGFAFICKKCGERGVKKGVLPDLPEKCKRGHKFVYFGPLWADTIFSSDWIRGMRKDAQNIGWIAEKTRKTLALIEEESEGPPLFYSVHFLSSKLKKAPKKMDFLIENLRKSGFFASRTHFDPNGIRTDGFELLLELLKER